MTTLRLYFAPWNGHRRISWTFHIQILYNKSKLHTLQKLFTLYTLFTDVNLFTWVIETLLPKFAIPQFNSIARRFTHHCPTSRHVKLRKQTDPTKKPVWRAILFQNLMEVRFVTAVLTRGFFQVRHDRGFAAQFSPQATGKKTFGTHWVRLDDRQILVLVLVLYGELIQLSLLN